MLRLVIAPKTATIAPGALQQFTARLLDEEFILSLIHIYGCEVSRDARVRFHG